MKNKARYTDPEYQKNYYLRNREKLLSRSLEYQAMNKDKKAEYDKRYNELVEVRRIKNEQTILWVRDNPKKRAEISKKYYEENKAKVFSLCAQRRKRLSNATPKWLTLEQKRQIKMFYAATPVGYHVDHIVPIKGKNVCGLHVPWNLQYLPAAENLRKGVKHE